MRPVKGLSLDEMLRGMVVGVAITRLMSSGATADTLNAAAAEMQEILTEYERAVHRPWWRRWLPALFRVKDIR